MRITKKMFKIDPKINSIELFKFSENENFESFFIEKIKGVDNIYVNHFEIDTSSLSCYDDITSIKIIQELFIARPTIKYSLNITYWFDIVNSSPISNKDFLANYNKIYETLWSLAQKEIKSGFLKNVIQISDNIAYELME